MSRYDYDLVAPVYDGAAAFYSWGAIRRSKRAAVAHVGPRDRVLFLGSGSGWDAVRAARRGADVTCLDVSHRMIEKARKRFERAQVDGTFAVEAMADHEPATPYDIVFANYFFNLFDPTAMRAHLEDAIRLIRPGGLLVIADVAPPTGTAPVRLAKRAYLQGGLAMFRALGLVSWHPVNDYAATVRELGLPLTLIERDDVALFRGGPVLFQALAFRKDGE